MNTPRIAFGLALAALLAAAACSKTEGGGQQGSSASSVKMDMAQAKEIFNSRCSACHGTNGDGTGPGAAALNPKPRNYHDAAWQKTVTDEQIKKTIIYGGAAVGKSPIMPANPDLDGKPDVVEGLVRIVRDFGKS